MNNESKYLSVKEVAGMLLEHGIHVHEEMTGYEIIGRAIDLELIKDEPTSVGSDNSFGPFGQIAMMSGGEIVHYLDFYTIAICKLVEVGYNGGRDE